MMNNAILKTRPVRGKRLAKYNAAFADALLARLIEKGAVEAHDGRFGLATVCGWLLFTVYPNEVERGAWVAAKFEQVECATALGLLWFNPYSGKWNHHYFDVPIEEALADVDDWVRRARLRAAEVA